MVRLRAKTSAQSKDSRITSGGLLLASSPTVSVRTVGLQSPSKKYFFTNKWFKSLVGCVIILFGLTSGILPSFAFFFAHENAAANVLSAGSLDFILSAESWQNGVGPEGLEPGETETRKVEVKNVSNTAFKYLLHTEQSGGSEQFCSALQLTARRGAVAHYSGSLLGLDLGEAVDYATTTEDTWLFEATLPAGSVFTNGDSCEFNIVYSGWQDGAGGGGFTDTESLSNALVFAVPIVEPDSDDPSQQEHKDHEDTDKPNEHEDSKKEHEDDKSDHFDGGKEHEDDKNKENNDRSEGGSEEKHDTEQHDSSEHGVQQKKPDQD